MGLRLNDMLTFAMLQSEKVSEEKCTYEGVQVLLYRPVLTPIVPKEESLISLSETGDSLPGSPPCLFKLIWGNRQAYSNRHTRYLVVARVHH